MLAQLNAGNFCFDDAGRSLHVAFWFWIERVELTHCSGHIKVDHLFGLATSPKSAARLRSSGRVQHGFHTGWQQADTECVTSDVGDQLATGKWIEPRSIQ